MDETVLPSPGWPYFTLDSSNQTLGLSLRTVELLQWQDGTAGRDRVEPPGATGKLGSPEREAGNEKRRQRGEAREAW